MQSFTELYKELGEKIDTGIEAVQWVDLWHNQVNFLEDEHPFPTPAVFLQFRTRDTEDIGEKVQELNCQVDCFLFYETFADTYKGSSNQDIALQFLESLDALHKLLHGSDGVNYTGMRRIGVNPVDTGNAGNLYQVSFACTLLDYGAKKEYQDQKLPETLNFEGNSFKVT